MPYPFSSPKKDGRNFEKHSGDLKPVIAAFNDAVDAATEKADDELGFVWDRAMASLLKACQAESDVQNLEVSLTETPAQLDLSPIKAFDTQQVQEAASWYLAQLYPPRGERPPGVYI